MDVHEAQMVFEHHNTICCAHSNTNKTIENWYKVITIWYGKFIELIYDNIQREIYQIVSFII